MYMSSVEAKIDFVHQIKVKKERGLNWKCIVTSIGRW